jgi:FkbM family methyltransferase
MKLREIKEHTFYEDILRDEIVVLDLGACRGEFINEIDSLYKVKKAILVEPNPTNFIHLLEKDNFILYNNLISNNSDDLLVFWEDPNSPYNGSTIFNYFNGVEHKIKSITIENIINDNNIDFIDILKIDIEGSEYDLLENISSEILDKIGQITVEFHDFLDPNLKDKTKKILQRIESFGFERISKPINYKFNSDDYDVLFFKNNNNR